MTFPAVEANHQGDAGLFPFWTLYLCPSARPPAFDGVGAVSDAQGVLLMRNQHDRAARLFCFLSQSFEDHALIQAVQIAGRFIQQQGQRFVQEGPRQADAQLLAAKYKLGRANYSAKNMHGKCLSFSFLLFAPGLSASSGIAQDLPKRPAPETQPTWIYWVTRRLNAFHFSAISLTDQYPFTLHLIQS